MCRPIIYRQITLIVLNVSLDLVIIVHLAEDSNLVRLLHAPTLTEPIRGGIRRPVTVLELTGVTTYLLLITLKMHYNPPGPAVNK